ncbi:hypothetical protein D3C87_1287860 [compost metagenome]
MPDLRVGGKGARQQVVDGDVVPHRLPRQAAHEADQPRTRTIGQAQLGMRRLHAARHDVHDAAEAPLDHAVHHPADHVDGAQHHGVQRCNPVFARPVPEVARQGTVGIVDQDIGTRAGGEGRVAALRQGQVGRYPAHADPGFPGNLGGGLLQGLRVARRDRHRHPLARQLQGARPAHAPAAAKHQCRLAADPQIHA